MREGIPLEIFARQALINERFEVFGIYPYEYYNRERDISERSVDIYASRDSAYASADDPAGRRGRLERNHLLVEVKQRRAGVEWIFSTLPKSEATWSIAGASIPIVNSGFERRPSETGLSTNANPKDVINAISQLNQAYVPFIIGLRQGASMGVRGFSRTYAAPNRSDITWLILITNARLRYFAPPTQIQGDRLRD
jgi:hypothetical protein